MKKLLTYYSSLFTGQSYYVNDGLQNFLIFRSIYKTYKIPASLEDTAVQWESRGLLNEKVKPPVTANYSLSPKVIRMYNSSIGVKFKGSCFKQDKVTFTPRYVVIYFLPMS